MTDSANFLSSAKCKSSNEIVPMVAAPFSSMTPAQCYSPLNLTTGSSCRRNPESETLSILEPVSVDAIQSAIRNKLEEIFKIPESNSLRLEEKTKSLADFYTGLTFSDKSYLVQTLADQYGVDKRFVGHVAGQIAPALARSKKLEGGQGHLHRVEDRLRVALVPRYQHLFTQFSRLDHGIRFVLSFRADVINMLRNPGIQYECPSIQSLNTTLFNLLSVWMSAGPLRLEKITWQSPCDLLQKICSYEAVQSIRNWSDLRRRVGPNRRCYAFTHSSLPRDPLLVVHAALASEPLRNIQTIIGGRQLNRLTMSINDADDSTDGDDEEDVKTIDTAVFYAITSTQKGLQGIEIGTRLLWRVISRISSELPRIHQFLSLSPIPGFRDWVLLEFNRFIHLTEVGENPDQLLLTPDELAEMSVSFQTSERRVFTVVRDVLLQDDWIERAHVASVLMFPLMRLCARYLYLEKKRGGYAVNAVANFHLRNGATLWRLNWLADTSSRGIVGSCGVMVNFRYFPEEMNANSINYAERQIIPVGEQIVTFIRHLELFSATRTPPDPDENNSSPLAGNRDNIYDDGGNT